MMPGAAGPTMIRHATAADAASLAQFAKSAFVDTFGHDNEPENVAEYVSKAFGEPVQRTEIDDPGLTIFLAERQGQLAGYAVLREGEPPEPVRAALQRTTAGSAAGGAVEIVRLYVGQRWLGSGVGAALMQRCLQEAAARERSIVWLGVWERNGRAIEFYRQWGFSDVGAQAFQLGAERQTDRIMSRRVAEAT